MFTAEELLPIKLTLELALITTVFLLLVATPLAWWSLVSSFCSA